MAMKYNASTGEWEEEEENSTLGGGNLPGSMPELDPFQIGTGLPQTQPVSTETAAPSIPKMPGYLDYGNWGATDWRKQLPTPTQTYEYGEGGMYPSGYSYAPFSANGYNFTADSSGYIRGITKDGAAVPAGDAEQLRYIGAGLLDPRFQSAQENWQNTPDLIDDYLANKAKTDPYGAAGVLGQINDRGTVGWGSADSTAFKPETYWGNVIGDPAAQSWWNSNMTPAAQSAADDPDNGFGDIGTALAIAAMIYSGGSLAGLWGGTGAAGAGAAGAGLAEGFGGAGMLGSEAMWGLGAAEGFGGAGALGSMADWGLAAEGFGGADILGGLADWGLGAEGFGGADVLGSMADWGLSRGADTSSILSSIFENTPSSLNWELPSPDAFNTFNPATDSYGMGTEAFSPGSEIFGPPPASEMEGLYIDDYGGGTNAMGEFVNGRGNRSILDNISNTMRDLGVDRETAAKLTQGGGKMFNSMTSPMGGSKYGPSPLGAGQGLMKLYSAYNSENQLKDTLGKFQGMYDKASNFQDPNRGRGDEANRLWTENFNNPRAGYDEFMTGAGRDFTNQARAQAAKSGKRGSYLNSGKMQSDLASMFMKNQLQRGDSISRGFASAPNTSMEAMKYAPGLMDMYNKQGGSMGMAIQDILGSTAGKGLINSVLEGYW